ncbi:MAG TPA: RNA polymerase sigma factor [Acidobacteriota bacterium]|nr:RNA polymerase sigma factor [Acidobacteriota bacterium]
MELHALVLDYKPRLQAYMYSRGLRNADIDDVTQTVFIKASRALPDYRGGNLDSWLFHIAHNAVIDHYRRERTRVFQNATELSEDLESTTESPQTSMHAQDLFIMLDRALQKRSWADRQTFLLFLDGYTHAEIAQKTGTKESVSKSRLYRTRQYLQETLPATLTSR